MLTPKSQVPSSQTTARRAKGSHRQSMVNENDPKLYTESPQVDKFSKASQKMSSPNQKIDVAYKNRNGSERSRREKSESISTIALYSRNHIHNTNQSISVRNSSVKSQTESAHEKTVTSATPKADKIIQSNTLLSYRTQKNEKTNLTLDSKSILEAEGSELTRVTLATQSSPQSNIRPRDFSKADKLKRTPTKENGLRLNSAVSPKNSSAQKSPLRSSRNSSGMDLSKDMSITTPKTNIKTLGCHKKSLSLQETAIMNGLGKQGEFPIDSKSALYHYGGQLSMYEKSEILRFEEIYFVSDRNHKIMAKEEKDYDDDKGEYLVVKNDHVMYRYEVVEMLGRGSFGQVLKVYDHKLKEYSALKIIRSQKKFHFQAKIEVDILQFMMQRQGSDYNITGLKDHFTFRNHVCLVFELMSLNLYDFLKKNKFKGFSIAVIRKFAIQILYALKFLSQHKLIHCDLKPENILLKHPNKTGIKLIDFGSSCFESEKLYTYIQSRFYRAPEIILGMSYSSQIDMWSFGCLLFELFTGQPIFPGESEKDQLIRMMEVLGVPDRSMIAKSPRKKIFFDEECNPLIVPNSKGKVRYPNTVPFDSLIQSEDKAFIDLIKHCLVYDPKDRFTANEALAHEWIVGGLPPDLQAQHIKLIESSPDYKKSVRVKEEILNPLYVKQRVNLESSGGLKMDTEPNYATWKSPISKTEFDSVQSEVFVSEFRSAKKPRKAEDSLEKKPSDCNQPKKKINLNLKQGNQEESIMNVTINLTDSKDFSVIQPAPKKSHHKSESMSYSRHKKSESQVNVISSLFSVNPTSYRSTTNRSSRQENSGFIRETKAKRSSFVNQNNGDTGIIGDMNESGNCKSVREAVSYASVGSKLNTTRASQLSATILADNTKFNTSSHSTAGLNPKKYARHNSSTLATDANSGIASIYQNTEPNSLKNVLNTNPGSNENMNVPYSSIILSSSNPQVPVNVSHHHQSLPNTSILETTSAAASHRRANNSINYGTGNNIELYKSLNSSQTRKSQILSKGDSIYSNAESAYFHPIDTSNGKDKFGSIKPSTTTAQVSHISFNFNKMNTSVNLNNSTLKSPQSTRLAEKNAQKSILAEKKLNSPNQSTNQSSQRIYSPKISELVYGKSFAGAKYDHNSSVSPRNISFSMLKYPVARKK